MGNVEFLTHQTVQDVFRAAFMRRVGVGDTRTSYGDLQDATGIPVRTLKSWREGAAMPHLDNFLKLAAVFGPDFTSEFLRVIGQGGVEHIDQAEAVNAHECAADLAGVLSDITERLRDGKFCYRDRAAVAPQLLALAHKAEEQAKAMLDDSKLRIAG